MADIKSILEQVKTGDLAIEEAVTQLKKQPFEDIGYAKIDHHRKLRTGVAEVIYGAGKTAEQIAGIVSRMLEAGQETIMVTRLDTEKWEAVQSLLPSDNKKGEPQTDAPGAQGTEKGARGAQYFEAARIAIWGKMPEPSGLGKIVIATGGTSDIPVAEEAAVTAEALGNAVVRLYDVGVAGIHRLLEHSEEIMTASVVIAIAGMEGALASVVGGLADCPVIAVPTSVGYGAAFEGLTALLSMLNSCASGVSVVNIDNGFGAGYLAHMINHMEAK